MTSAGYSYDNAGNLLADGSQTYTYDPLGRLASTVVGGSTTGYTYNGDDTLAAKTVGGATTRHTLDGAGGLSERLGATTGAATTWYVRGFGGELAREVGGTPTWYLADRLGSVRGEYTTGAGGKPVGAKTNYDPFGQPEAGSGLGAPADYGFTGEPQGDGPAAGGALVQLRARWYAPGQGAFVSRDPFAGLADAPQSYSPYAYAHNDPTNLTDPTGRTPLREPGAGGTVPAEPLSPPGQPGQSGIPCPGDGGEYTVVILPAAVAPPPPTVTMPTGEAVDRFVRGLPVRSFPPPGAGLREAVLLCLRSGLCAITVVVGFVFVAGLAGLSALDQPPAADRTIPVVGGLPAHPLPRNPTGIDTKQDDIPYYHRWENTTTQTPETARKQVASQEIWGKTPDSGYKPAVQAIRGRLEPGRRGIEFTTPIPPYGGSPRGQAYWRAPTPGVIEFVYEGEDYVKIPVFITKNTQT